MYDKVILAIDDMADALNHLEILLNDYYDVRLAQSPHMALTFLEKNKVDLILLDIEMREMTGFVFLSKFIDSDINNRKVPIIMTTSHSEMSYIEEALKNGVKDYLLKPIKAEALYKKLASTIGMPKYKITSLEGKLECLKDAATSMDYNKAKSLMEDIARLIATEPPKVTTDVKEIVGLMVKLDYKGAIIKIEELINYLPIYRKKR